MIGCRSRNHIFRVSPDFCTSSFSRPLSSLLSSPLNDLLHHNTPLLQHVVVSGSSAFRPRVLLQGSWRFARTRFMPSCRNRVRPLCSYNLRSPTSDLPSPLVLPPPACMKLCNLFTITRSSTCDALHVPSVRLRVRDRIGIGGGARHRNESKGRSCAKRPVGRNIM